MCLKGKQKAKLKPGNYQCRRCGTTHKQKGKLCEPGKLK